MYDIKWIREHPQAFKKGLERRGLDAEPIYNELMKLDEQRRANETFAQRAKADINKISAEIGAAKKAGDQARVTELMEKVSRLKGDITKASAQVADDSSSELGKKLAEIPNRPLDDVPDGADEHSNVEHHKSGAKRDYSFKPKEHFDLGTALGMMDFELAAKLSGARFVILQKGLARMERALGQFMLDLHTEMHGYTEVNPPLMVKDDVMFGTAQLPKFRSDQFQAGRIWSGPENDRIADQFIKELEEKIASGEIESLDESPDKPAPLSDYLDTPKGRLLWNDIEQKLFGLWLIPTAEVPLTNLVRESIVEESSLPRRYTACTPCFRAEAGAAGKDTRGMIRQHQFTKVELVSITTPEESKKEHERMLACAEEVLKKLDLHYRVITLCAGDMGFAAQKTYDIEVWLPGQNMYREISSCSVCGEFQARRMNARYRPIKMVGGALIGQMGLNTATFNQAPRPSAPQFVHTLNGSGVAVGRALIAVMETYQQEDGSILVPDALKPYMGGMTKIEKK
jgi:seryl-tRNA synthetase